MLRRSPAAARPLPEPSNPLQFRGAVQMALLFQIVVSLVHVLRTRLGGRGLLLTGALAGVTDVDAATFSMARAVVDGLTATAAAKAVAAGILANTGLKLALALIVGRGGFRVAASLGLIAISIAIALALVFVP